MHFRSDISSESISEESLGGLSLLLTPLWRVSVPSRIGEQVKEDEPVGPIRTIKKRSHRPLPHERRRSQITGQAGRGTAKSGPAKRKLDEGVEELTT